MGSDYHRNRVVRRHLNVPSSAFGEVRRQRNEARVAATYLVQRLTDQTVSATAEQFEGVSVAAISNLAEHSRKQAR